MKLKIPKEHLLVGLQRVQNIVERRTTMPILSNALLKTEKEGLALSATDLEVGVQSLLPAEIMDQGSITVKARSLLDIVRELPETTILLQTRENNRLEITANKTVFNVVGLPAEDFPEIPGFNLENNLAFVRMNGTVILSMLEKTLFAASSDEARYQLNGVYFETLEVQNQRVFRMVATDAHRLALVDNAEALFDENAWKQFKEGVIVPRKGLTELRRLLSEGKEDFLVTVHSGLLCVKRDQLFLSMRLIEGKYADYRRIIPEISQHPITLQREPFLSSLRRMSLMSSDKSRSVTFHIVNGTLHLSSQSPDLGEAHEEIPIEYRGEELKVGFNSKYLMDALSTLDSENVVLEMRSKQHPGVLRSCSGLNHINVVMPMRI